MYMHACYKINHFGLTLLFCILPLINDNTLGMQQEIFTTPTKPIFTMTVDNKPLQVRLSLLCVWPWNPFLIRKLQSLCTNKM